MSTESATLWWLHAAHRLGLRWFGGYIPAPDDWPPPRDYDRLGQPEGIPVALGSTTATVVDYYRQGRRRTPVGAEMSRFKYHGDLDAGWRLVVAADKLLRRRRIAETMDVIVPVPPLPVFRDFRPSLWLARQLGALLERPVITGIFRRTRPGTAQKNVPHGRRKRANVAGLWKLGDDNRFVVVGRRILLIDDIADSGQTLLEVKRVLCEAGAEVTIFAYAKTAYRP